jgi:hypothetical protein
MKSKAAPDLGVRGADATFFTTTYGTGNFCRGEVHKQRMKGRTFHWMQHGPCKPAGAHFEIRPKPGQTSPLNPGIPKGVEHMWADVPASVPAGTIYRYSLWQVLANGQEQELDDPELEIGQVLNI